MRVPVGHDHWLFPDDLFKLIELLVVQPLDLAVITEHRTLAHLVKLAGHCPLACCCQHKFIEVKHHVALQICTSLFDFFWQCDVSVDDD